MLLSSISRWFIFVIFSSVFLLSQSVYSQNGNFSIEGLLRSEIDETIVGFNINGNFLIDDIVNIYTNDRFIKSKIITENLNINETFVSNISIDVFDAGKNNVTAKVERGGVEINETVAFIFSIKEKLNPPRIFSVVNKADEVTLNINGKFNDEDSLLVYLNGVFIEEKTIDVSKIVSGNIVISAIIKLKVGENEFEVVLKRQEEESAKSNIYILDIPKEVRVEKKLVDILPKKLKIAVAPICLDFYSLGRFNRNKANSKIGKNIVSRDNIFLTNTESSSAYIYTNIKGNWYPVELITRVDYRNAKVSASISGEEIILGFPEIDMGKIDTGSVYVYKEYLPLKVSSQKIDKESITDNSTYVDDFVSGVEKNVSTYIRTSVLVPPKVEKYELFGSHITSNKSFLIVSSLGGGGNVYVYKKKNGFWTNPVKIEKETNEFDNFGYFTDVYGDTLVVSSPGKFDGSGVVYVYNLKNLKNPIVLKGNVQGERFGSSVFINDKNIFIGASGKKISGNVYIYKRNKNSITFSEILRSPKENNIDKFGTSLAVKHDILAVGSPDSINVDGEKTGVVYLFKKIGENWKLYKTILSDTLNEADKFGLSVNFVNNDLIIGAHGSDIDGKNKGSVFVSEGKSVNCYAPTKEIDKKEEIVADKKEVDTETFDEIITNITSFLVDITKQILDYKSNIKDKEVRFVEFDKSTIITNVEKRARELRGLSAPGLPAEIFVKLINEKDVVTIETTNSSIPVENNLNKQEIPEGNLYKGLINEEVHKLQIFLNQNGFIITNSGPGSPDNETNIFDDKTEKALKSFQLVNGIKTTGILDQPTRNVILTYITTF